MTDKKNIDSDEEKEFQEEQIESEINSNSKTETENEEVSEYKYLDDDVLNKEIMYDPEMNYQLHLCMYLSLIHI